MSDKFVDADEIQSLIRYHCECIIECIKDEGISPAKQPVLVKTAERILELSNRLAECPVKAR